MIYIVAHKEVSLPDLPGYQPIQVGGAAEDFPGFVRDNTGDEISAKNPNYCELTALYWIWKNTDDPYKGLVHYRRFFGKGIMGSDPNLIFSYDQMVDLLKNSDILLCRPSHYHVNARKQLLRSSSTEAVFDSLRKVIEESEPEYLQAFDTFFAGNTASLYNMMFCRRELFDAYCEWLFGILARMELLVDLDSLNRYQKRVYGFLAERLLNIWVMKNGLRVRYTGVVNTELSFFENARLLRRDLMNEIRFRVRKGGKSS